MRVYRISAITLKVNEMEKSCQFYSRIPGFRIVYGGAPDDTFSTFEISEGAKKAYLNLELIKTSKVSQARTEQGEEPYGSRKDFGRIIFYTENVDGIYSYMETSFSQSMQYLKPSLLMLHGAGRGTFTSESLMATNCLLLNHYPNIREEKNKSFEPPAASASSSPRCVFVCKMLLFFSSSFFGQQKIHRPRTITSYNISYAGKERKKHLTLSLSLSLSPLSLSVPDKFTASICAYYMQCSYLIEDEEEKGRIDKGSKEKDGRGKKKQDEQLAQMKCKACRGGEPTLKDVEIAQLHQQVPDWSITESKDDGISRLNRSFKFRDFAEALAFTNKVGKIAEKQGHHPDILLEWGKVKVTWWTHAIKGLHRNDFIMAAKTDELYDGGSSVTYPHT